MSGMQRLTLPLISAQHPEQDLATITTLSFPKRGIKEVLGLDACEKLSRLDLSNNSLSSLQGLALCANLKWLSVAGNCLQSLKGIEGLSKLTVLNASHNELISMNEVASLVDLRALILNDNELDSICRLDRLTNLNTLVLSHNPIRELGKSFVKISSITKLSLSYCRLQTVGSSLKRSVQLKELRLAHNQLMSLPLELERNGKLQILDLGHNYLRQWSDIQVVGVLHDLKNLNFHGNAVCDDKQYKDKIRELLPNLQILDGHPIGSIKKYQKKRKTASKGNNSIAESHVDPSEVADDSEKDLKAHDCKGTEINLEKPSKRRKDKEKKGIKLDKSETDENRPFIDLIATSEKNLEPKLDAASNGMKSPNQYNNLKMSKKKVDSGVVSILDGDTKSSQPKGKIRKFGPMFFQNLREVEIGTGGPSKWDTNPVETISQAQSQAHEGKSGGALSQSEYTFKTSSYSRWQLKRDRTDI